MLYNLDWLETGQQFPPPSEAARLKRYADNRLLFDGDHDAVFGDWYKVLREDKEASFEVILPWFRRLTRLWAAMVAGEPPAISLPDDAAERDTQRLTELTQRNRANTLFHEGVQDMSRYGDAVLKVRTEKKSAVIEGVNPEIWFPIVDRANVRKIKQHVLAWSFESEAQAKQKYLYAEIHSENFIEYRLYHLSGTPGSGASGQIGEMVPDSEARRLMGEDWRPQDTHMTGTPLVVHVPNSRSTGRLHGYDDYSDVMRLVQESEVRYGQLARILDKHADPIVAGPRPQPLTDLEKEAVRQSGGKYFIVEGEENPPQYIVWDAQQAAAFEELKRLKEEFYFASETSPAAFSDSEQGGAASGTALALRMTQPKHKASRIVMELDPAVKEVIKLAAKLEGWSAEDLHIDWSDGLPDDQREQVEIEAQRVQNQLSSLKSALMRLDDLDEQQAEDELERIRKELNQSEGAPNPTADGNGSNNGDLAAAREALEGRLAKPSAAQSNSEE